MYKKLISSPHYKYSYMLPKKDHKKQSEQVIKLTHEAKRVARNKQQQTDPQITELKGFLDPMEDLEPKIEDDGTHNPVKPAK
ncbi:MAG: hypothetical protein NVS1B13_08240 [Flavisolibacter sp.]